MNDNPAIQQYSNGKPVNINISFNISRKQVMQNINPLDPDQTYSFNNPLLDDPLTNSKPKNATSRPVKTPQLVHTDRNIYSKDLEFARATEELKRKKKRKRSSGDYTADKTSHFPFYPIELDKSLPSHKRGLTTAIVKKTASSTKSKKQPIKIDNYIKQGTTIPIAALLGQEKKTQPKSGRIERNLKNILTKLINNEESKRSLPLPSVPSKSKYVQSTSLTSRKMSSTKTGKKRHSKSHMMNKERANHAADNIISAQIDAFRNPAILEKLSNFKSNENSILISEIDNMEENQRQSPRERADSERRIVIKTDQSIECIEEIHNWEKDFYRDTFFQERQKGKNSGFFRKSKQQDDSDHSDTLLLIETYVKLLNAPDEEEIQIREKVPNQQNRERNVNERVQIYDGNNYMNNADFINAQKLFQAQRDEEEDQKDAQRSQGIKLSGTDVQRMLDNYEQSEQTVLHSTTRPMWKRPSQESETHSSQMQGMNQKLKANINIKRIESHEQRQAQVGQSHLMVDLALQESPLMFKEQEYSHMTNFRPFISSEMGRDDHNGAQSEERARVNELKKHEIQKWSHLLDYIKSNMNSETNTQEVLEQVYQYLSQAKIDLIKQGRNIVETSKQSTNQKDKQSARLEEEFTNKLSSQLEKSENPHARSTSRDLQSFDGALDQSLGQGQGQDDENQGDEDQEDSEAKSFKQDYESQGEQESIKFMNLSTIETALRNRFNQLTHKRDKELQRLDSLMAENKLSQQQYQEQKSQVEIQYKTETNEILAVKKNIWKGYNEAKGILDKSYINSRVQEEFKGQFRQDKKAKKDRKMMKCLSESYLNKKKIDYKKFIEEEQKKREEESEDYGMKRQHGQANWNDDQEDQQYEDNSNMKGSHEYYYDEKSDQDQDEQSQGQSSKRQSSGHGKGLQSSEHKSKSSNVDDEFEKISKKLNKLKEQHETVLANETKNKQGLSSSSKQQSASSAIHSKESDPHINEFTHTRDHYQKDSSPVMVSISPDSSVHFEQIQKDLDSDSEEGDYIDENLKEVKHSSSDEEDKDYEDESDEKREDNENDPKHKLLAQDDYSDEEEEIIARELAETSKFGSLQTKNSQPLKKALQQFKQAEHLDEPKPTSKSSKSSTMPIALVEPASKTLSPATQALYKKLSYLTEEDREDIFEFMFLDLCIQLYQEPCQDNKLMSAVNKHVTKQYELAKRKKGVKTNLNVVKDYLKRFCGYLIRTNNNVLNNLNVPMGPTAIEMLKYMHENQDFDEQPEDGQGVVTLIIPVSVFDTFERSLLPTLEFEKYYDNEQKQQERVNFLKNILHIHNKALFDALNEFLDHQRPFGIWGKPFPWKKSSSFTHKFTELQQQERLKKSAEKVVEACSYVCGLLVDKQQSLVGKAKISEGYIEQIREDRISRMLANEMIENEERWVFYDDEETEVLVETSNYVYNMLLREAMGDLMRVKSIRENLGEVQNQDGSQYLDE